MISRLLAQLQAAGLLLSDQEIDTFSEAQSLLQDEDIADALWLAYRIGGSYELSAETEIEIDQEDASKTPELGNLPTLPVSQSPAVPVTIPQNRSDDIAKSKDVAEEGLPVEVQAAAALPDTRGIGRGLRPLMRKFPSRTRSTLDEQATVNQIAERNIWLPILKPLPERWFDLDLVIEASQFSFIWQETLAEFQHMLECQGAFRNVRTWSIEGTDTDSPKLVTRKQGSNQDRPNRSPKELVNASGRRLVLLVSDCRSSIWQQGVIHDWLAMWGAHGPAAVVQLLPERLWSQSELDVGFGVQVSALVPGVANTKLSIKAQSTRNKSQPVNSLTVPVVTLTANALKQWALVVSAAGRQRTPARLFDLDWVKSPERDRSLDIIRPEAAEARIELFEATASPLAQQLALRMAAVPVEMSVVQMIQQEVLPDVRAVHIAEVYASGLLQEVNATQARGQVRYDFAPGVRECLNQATPVDETLQVFDALSKRIARTLGFEITSFTALLLPKSYWSENAKAAILPFAQVATEVLSYLGGQYAELARQVEIDARRYSDWIRSTEPDEQEPNDDLAGVFPPLTEFEFVDAQFDFDDGTTPSGFPPALQYEEFSILTLEIDSETESSERADELEPFEVTVVTLTGSGQQWQRQEQQQTAYRYIELLEFLPSGVFLEMVAIPEGRFMMGSPSNEPERSKRESPQHEVTVESFFMGRYPVTQAQWSVVAAMDQVERELEADPARFKGDNRPVERVYWHDAVEFCARLSVHTGREYRLPSEAEWEYACRAGTTTPFHFGAMITTDVVNYNGRAYADGPQGERRGETTPVDHFDIANGFGLSDMHGNVWEWCQDHWHENYEGAPTDGSAWIEAGNASRRVVRGGSWLYNPGGCRSAIRLNNTPDVRFNDIGFRVVCSAPRILP